MHKQPEFLKLIEIDGCYAFDFMDKTTLVAISKNKNAIYRFDLLDESSLQWNLSGEKEVFFPTALRCVNEKVYVVSFDNKL